MDDERDEEWHRHLENAIRAETTRIVAEASQVMDLIRQADELYG